MQSIHYKTSHEAVEALLYSLEADPEPFFLSAENGFLERNQILNIHRGLFPLLIVEVVLLCQSSKALQEEKSQSA
jgi:hypothetical protein